MKKTYIAPSITTCELGTEKGYCEGLAATSGIKTNGFGTTTSNNTKDEFSGDIDFSDITGADMVKRNPWGSQW